MGDILAKTYMTVANINDFNQENYFIKSIMGRKIAIIKNEDGTYHAVDCKCKHQGADLLPKKKGIIKSLKVSCPRHGWVYNLKDGKCLNKDSAPLKVYEVKVENKQIKVGFNIE